MYNRTAIFQAAWAFYRGLSRNLHGELAGTFADCLAMAWGNAKLRLTMQEPTAEDKLFLLQMADSWAMRDSAEVAWLEREISTEKKAAAAA